MSTAKISVTWLAVVLLFSIIAQTPSTNAQQATPAPSGNGATSSNAFAFYPADTGLGSFFDVTVKPGGSTDLTVLLANTGDTPQSLRTYASDAYTAEGGGLAIAEFGDESNQVTRWLSFKTETHSVEPGKGIEISLTLSVPDSARPGQYVTSVVAENSEPRAIEGTDMLTQTIRYAVPIFITVPGETSASLDIGDVRLESDGDSQILIVEVSNTGDLHLRPAGDVQVRNHAGDAIATIPVGVGTVFARTTTTLVIVMPPLGGTDSFDIVLNLSDTETGAEVTTEKTGLVVKAPGATPAPPPIAVASANVEPGPSVDNIQFAVVDATITNTGEPVTNAQLSLLVSNDGEEVERFPISQSLALPGGETEVNTRYIPLDGWSPGEWTFELLLETVEPNGAAVVVASEPIDGGISVP